MAAHDASIDSRRFRHVLGHFATGVAVITAAGPNGPAGMVVSSFTSVSLEPPLVAFLPDKSSTSWPEIEAAGAFCVNILGSGQQELCAQFARRGIDKFAGVSWQRPPSGAPVLEGVMAWIDCELTQTFESGDHYIAIGRVLQLEATESVTPLVFFQGGYQNLELPPSASPGSEFARVTLGDLARTTGVDEQSLQRYAHATDGVVNEIVGGYVRTFHARCVEIADGARTARDGVAELLRIAFGSMTENRVAIMILQNERPYLRQRDEFAYLEPLERHIDEIWNGLLQRGIDSGEFRPELDAEVAYRFVRDVIFAAARWYSSTGAGPADPDEEAERRAEEYRALILHGLLN